LQRGGAPPQLGCTQISLLVQVMPPQRAAPPVPANPPDPPRPPTPPVPVAPPVPASTPPVPAAPAPDAPPSFDPPPPSALDSPVELQPPTSTNKKRPKVFVIVAHRDSITYAKPRRRTVISDRCPMPQRTRAARSARPQETEALRLLRGDTGEPAPRADINSVTLRRRCRRRQWQSRGPQ
jgi:hypothetical protein